MALTKTSYSMTVGSCVNILDFIPQSEHAAIAAGTSTYDCHSAITAAIASVTIGTGYSTAGPEIYFPVGFYKVNSPIELKKQVKLRGTVAGMPDGMPVRLIFPADTKGIIVNTYNTINGGVEVPPTIGADGSIIENLSLIGGGGTDATAHAIWLRARATIRNVTIQGFSGNGVNIVASACGGGALEGNANNFSIDTMRIVLCGGHGLFIDGADVNAGVAKGVDATSNQGYGIYDSSFLGNTHIAHHTDNNTLGAYKSDDINARNLFLGCYAESGQPTSSMVFPAQVVGGAYGSGITGNFINNNEIPTQVKGSATAVTSQTVTLAAGAVDPSDGTILSLTSSDEPAFPMRLKYTLGRWFMNWANSGFQFLSIYNEQATIANGYARDSTNAKIGLPNFYHGDYTQMKYRGVDSAAPTTGTWLQGDIVFNTAPTAGGTIGFVCTTAGTPGTWKTFGAISA